MKHLNYNLIQIAIIVVLIIFIARICYLYSIFNKKHNLIGEILVTWKKKTSGGNIQKDIYKLYKDDYFLSRYLIHDDSTHIHLITHKDKYNLYEFMKIYRIRYIKNIKHIICMRVIGFLISFSLGCMNQERVFWTSTSCASALGPARSAKCGARRAPARVNPWPLKWSASRATLSPPCNTSRGCCSYCRGPLAFPVSGTSVARTTWTAFSW